MTTQEQTPQPKTFGGTKDKIKYTVTCDPALVPDILKRVMESEVVALDTETTGLEFMTSSLFGIGVADKTEAWYLHAEAMAPFLEGLKPLAADPNYLWLFHNYIFDAHFFKQHDVIFKRYMDTMVAAHMIDENLDKGLKKLAPLFLGVDPDTILEFNDLRKRVKAKNNKWVKEQWPGNKKEMVAKRKEHRITKFSDVTIDMIPIEELGFYGAKDPRFTWDLWPIFEPLLEAEGQLEATWEWEMPFVEVLRHMEESGMGIDLEEIRALGKDLELEMKEGLDKWDKISDGRNPRSNPQKQEWFFEIKKYEPIERTASGAPRCDKLFLQRIARKGDEAAKALLQYGAADKLHGTYVTSFLEKHVNGRLYGSYNPTGTVTGRISSSNPNLQNVPLHTLLGARVRRAFIAGPGKILLVVDYSQMELRILAHFSQDPDLIRIFVEGLDPHQYTADLVGIDRHLGKTLNFLMIYGGGWMKLCNEVEKWGYPRPAASDAKQWINAYYNKAYKGVMPWKNRIIRWAAERGYMIIPDGRKRRLPDLKSSDGDLRARAERQAVNFMIQGMAGLMIKKAMVRIHGGMSWFDPRIRMLSQVHDELIFELPFTTPREMDVADSFSNYVQGAMEELGPEYNFRVPIVADPKLDRSWEGAK